MVAGRQTVELATDNPFECFISLRNGLHTVFIVHLDAHVAVNTPFVLYLTDKESVFEEPAFNAFFQDTSFLEIIALVGLYWLK